MHRDRDGRPVIGPARNRRARADAHDPGVSPWSEQSGAAGGATEEGPP